MTRVAHRKILITGCGRSGTGFVADCLNQSGISCGHEEKISANRKDYSFSAESSWFAAPYISEIDELTHIVHVVRKPTDVINSFLRIGFFRTYPLYNASEGRQFAFARLAFKRPSTALKRLNYTLKNRRFVAHHSSAFLDSTEARRAERYWTDWNTMIEKELSISGVPYIRVQPTELQLRKVEIEDFLNIPNLRISSFYNKKSHYPVRTAQRLELSDRTVDMAKTYGL